MNLHCYDYVNHPYAEVRAALLANPLDVFHRATTSAATRAVTLHARIGGSDVGRDALVDVAGVEESVVFGAPATKISLTWRATAHPAFFPTMDATVSVYALAPRETQLDFEGAYLPPLGPLGTLFDGVLGHRIAEATVLHFIQDVASWLRTELDRAPVVVHAS